MKTIAHTGGITWDNTTNVFREVPILRNFPKITGIASAVNVITTLRVSVTATYNYTVYLFKTFKGSSAYWDDRTDNKYQYPQSEANYMQAGYIGDLLASASFSEKLTYSSSGGDHVLTKSLALTDFGKRVENWAGDVYLAIINNSEENLYWGNGKTSTISLEYNSGVVKYSVNGENVNCLMYYAVNGDFVQVIPRNTTSSGDVEPAVMTPAICGTAICGKTICGRR